MKKAFEKTFGIIMGVYAAVAATVIIDNALVRLGVRKEAPKKENSESKEES
nr:hypothetical protein [uncultured Mediterraneibacter sp.]